MLDDPTRSWIKQRPSAAVYANGTRLFAYRALRATLTCGELAHGLEEIQAVTNSLTQGIAGLTIDQTDRVRGLSTQAEGELSEEHAERCKGDTSTG
jgi:hypothetical protein